jgi:hypothetical protein
MTLAALPLTHPLQYVRPRGWATPGFIMLTGFAVAAIYAGRSTLRARTTSKLYQRGALIGLVAVISNMAFLHARAIVEGTWTPARALRISTLQEPWSISGVLLATAIVLGLAPWLLRATARLGPPRVFALATALTLALDAAIRYAPISWHASTWFTSLFIPVSVPGTSYLTFPLVFVVALAVWAFALGALVVGPSQRWALLGWGILAIAALPTNIVHWSPSLLFEARLLIVLGALALLGRLAVCRIPFAALAMFGRSALLIFIVHRVILQAGVRVLAPLRSSVLASVLIGVTLLVCLALAYSRDRAANRAHTTPAELGI